MPTKRRSDTLNNYNLRSKIKKVELLRCEIRLKRCDGVKRVQIDALPNEIMAKIFHNLDLVDIANVTLVSRKWNQLSKLAKVTFTVTKDNNIDKILHPDERSELKTSKEKYDESDLQKLSASRKFSELVYKVDLSDCGLKVFELTKTFTNLKTLRLERFELKSLEEAVEFWEVTKTFEESVKHLYFDVYPCYNCHAKLDVDITPDVISFFRQYPTGSYRVNYCTKELVVTLLDENKLRTLELDLPFLLWDEHILEQFSNLTKLSILKIPFGEVVGAT